jgi:hypothetical protein
MHEQEWGLLDTVLSGVGLLVLVVVMCACVLGVMVR